MLNHNFALLLKSVKY